MNSASKIQGSKLSRSDRLAGKDGHQFGEDVNNAASGKTDYLGWGIMDRGILLGIGEP